MKEQWNPGLYNDKHAFVYEYGAGLVELLSPQPHMRILDLGCGSGQLTAEIKARAGEVVGIDQSGAMIADAQARYPEIEFYVADAANFEMEERFCAIFSNATLHWVTDYEACVACMYRALKPGGRMVVEFGGKGNVQTIVQQLRASLAARGYESQSKQETWYFPSIGEYTPVLEAAGFRVTLAMHYDRPTPLSDEAAGIKDWLAMFGATFFEGIPQAEVEVIKQAVQDNLQSTCLKDGTWYADYKRLRIVAEKPR